MSERIKLSGIKRKAAIGLAAAGLALGSGVVTAAQSHAGAAADCSGWSWSNPDTGSGYSTGTYALKTGPYAACGNTGQTYNGTKLYYHCYVVNSYGNTWTHARIAGTSTQGWISDANLTINPDGSSQGALEPC
ncbi:SH3 domain-containing protein [Streptomyces sp. NPDC001595]|uniref:SH3 domain-containing protein n=1 Tax=Streptomyces sp. NPDC001532 TaxID=3154520 RepID=UPI00331B6935